MMIIFFSSKQRAIQFQLFQDKNKKEKTEIHAIDMQCDLIGGGRNKKRKEDEISKSDQYLDGQTVMIDVKASKLVNRFTSQDEGVVVNSYPINSLRGLDEDGFIVSQWELERVSEFYDSGRVDSAVIRWIPENWSSEPIIVGLVVTEEKVSDQEISRKRALDIVSDKSSRRYTLSSKGYRGDVVTLLAKVRFKRMLIRDVGFYEDASFIFDKQKDCKRKLWLNLICIGEEGTFLSSGAIDLDLKVQMFNLNPRWLSKGVKFKERDDNERIEEMVISAETDDHVDIIK